MWSLAISPVAVAHLKRWPEKMKMPFEQAKEKLGDESVSRYGDLLKTTLGLSFGGLVFLLAFEKDYAPTNEPYYLLVYLGWLVMSLSALAGVYSLVLWAERPSRRRSEARFESVVHEGERVQAIVIPKEVSRREEWTFRVHIYSFVVSVIFLTAYKVLRFCS